LNARVLLTLVGSAIVFLAIVLVSVVARSAEPTMTLADPSTGFAGAALPPGVRAPDFRLRDEQGRPVSLRDARGKPALVTFLYTDCEDSCPIEAQQVRGALDELGEDLPAFAVAVNPPTDTAARARRFNAEQRTVGRLRWVLGSRDELRPVWRGFFIREQRSDAEHQSRILLVDKRGFQRVAYPGDQATPDRLAHDLRVLLEEDT
jgi:protein SCO1